MKKAFCSILALTVALCAMSVTVLAFNGAAGLAGTIVENVGDFAIPISVKIKGNTFPDMKTERSRALQDLLLRKLPEMRFFLNPVAIENLKVLIQSNPAYADKAVAKGTTVGKYEMGLPSQSPLRSKRN